MSRTHQFFADSFDAKKGEALIEGSEHVHLKRVLRLKKGDHILISDGKGALFHAVISGIDSEITHAHIQSHVEWVPESPIEITLIQSLPKRRKMEWILQKSTELGITRFVPVFSEHSIPRFSDETWRRKAVRWAQIIKEAAKLSYRGVIPTLMDVTSFNRAISLYRCPLNILCTPDGERSLRQCLSDFSEVQKVTVAIGPEGGFSQSEAAHAADLGFISCNLGPRILRLETAVVKILAVFQYVYGDG